MTVTMDDPLVYFKTIKSVRETTSPVYEHVKKNNEGTYFNMNLSKMNGVVDYLCKIIARDYKTDYASIPPHGRWQHINAGNHPRMENLIDKWRKENVDELEISRRLVDLIVISVLVDAGAGNVWKYVVEEEGSYNRSEGLAVASYHMFIKGELSDDATKYPHKVSGKKLRDMTMEQFVNGFQICEKTNPLSGSEGRLALIKKLGNALVENNDIFGPEARPGAMIDYMFLQCDQNEQKSIELNFIWDTLMKGFVSIWPKGRTTIGGNPLGDVWALDTKRDSETNDRWGNDRFLNSLVSFHKLTQWLCYSLLVPFESFGHRFTIKNKELQTGLPEYRNGGLFYDFGVLKLKPVHLKRGKALSAELNKDISIPTFTADDGAIVEWRCLTIGLLDELLVLVNDKLGVNLSLPQVIEAGSWKAGREIAAELRPLTKGPPIDLHSDGTVF